MTKRLRKGSIGEKIAQIVDRGLKLTVREMAQRLGYREGRIRKALGVLRRQGYAYRLIGTESGVKQGVIVDVMKNEKYFDESNLYLWKDKYARFGLHIKMIEAGWLTFPEKREEIEGGLIDMQRRLLDYRVGIKSLTPGKKYGNNNKENPKLKAGPTSTKKV